MTEEAFIRLAGKVADGLASPEELELYLACYEAYQQDPEIWEEIAGEARELKQESLSKFWNQAGTARTPAPTRSVRMPLRWAAAAAVAALLCGIWFFNSRDQRGVSGTALAYGTDIAPGSNGATLTLSNGKTIRLNGSKSGVVIHTGAITYNDGSSLAAADETRLQNAQTLTASTGRGQTYQVTLPDGTKAWLNAATTLSFPSTFAHATSRNVLVDGEAYFEVFKDKSMPFIVKTKGHGQIDDQEIRVLGTHFNVNAYRDERSIETTLLEGSVAISSGSGAPVTLVPNEQARNNGSQIKVAKVNPASFIAWKNGEFRFDDEPLGSIMRKIARWYDVEVEYEGIDPAETYWGTISRFEQVSKVLENLELTSTVNFKITGKKIIVYRLNQTNKNMKRNLQQQE